MTPPLLCPVIVICLVVEIPLVHVHDPCGMRTVSPFEAVLMAVWTSEVEQLVALIVAARLSEHTSSRPSARPVSKHKVGLTIGVPFHEGQEAVCGTEVAR